MEKAIFDVGYWLGLIIMTLINLGIFGLNLKLYTEFFKERVKDNGRKLS